MESHNKRHVTYNKIRLSLFTRSYCARVLLNILKDNYSSRTINRLGSILNLDTNLLKRFFVSEKYPRKLPNPNTLKRYLVQKERILVYLKVEKELINLMLEKHNSENTLTEDYNRALMEPAMERVAGNYLYKIEDDREFEEKLSLLKIKYKTYYYSVVYKYKLPSPRIVAFITRLISPL